MTRVDQTLLHAAWERFASITRVVYGQRMDQFWLKISRKLSCIVKLVTLTVIAELALSKKRDEGGKGSSKDESGKFVESDSCGPDLAECRLGSACFDRILEICDEDGSIPVEECKEA